MVSIRTIRLGAKSLCNGTARTLKHTMMLPGAHGLIEHANRDLPPSDENRLLHVFPPGPGTDRLDIETGYSGLIRIS